MSTTRSHNMKMRRERILLEARRIITNQGFEALNVRDLAIASELTVPTIYNLIGNKNKLLEALLISGFERFEQILGQHQDVSITEAPQIIVDTLARLFGEDESYYRAAGLAGEKLDNQYDINGKRGIMRQPLEKIITQRCQQAIDEGMLRGNLSAATLSEHIIASFQVACRDWFHKTVNLQQFRAIFLRGYCICLAADANDTLREKLTVLMRTATPAEQ